MTARGHYGMTPLYVILTMFLVRIPAFREKGTDHWTRSVPLFAYSVQRAAKSGSLMGDPVQEHYGMTAWGNHGMIPPLVILTILLVRISVFAVFSRPDPVQKHHGMTEEARKRDRP